MPSLLCEHCTGVCCQYIALPLETPETRGDFDDIRWYLLHDNVSVFVEGGEWYICLASRCRHLLDDHRCGIYASRPRICRQYSTENCDYHSGDYDWEAHFTCAEHLDDYLRARGVSPGGSRKTRGSSKCSTIKNRKKIRPDWLFGFRKGPKKLKTPPRSARLPEPTS